MAAGEGFEPSQTESESVVLPLHNPAKCARDCRRKSYYSKSSEFVKGKRRNILRDFSLSSSGALFLLISPPLTPIFLLFLLQKGQKNKFQRFSQESHLLPALLHESPQIIQYMGTFNCSRKTAFPFFPLISTVKMKLFLSIFPRYRHISRQVRHKTLDFHRKFDYGYYC